MLLCLGAATAPAAEPDSLRVLDSAGTVEIRRGSGGWLPLAPSARPSAGDRIRTGEKSTLDVGFDRSLDGIARLGEKSQAILEAPARWMLERGKLWVLWEDSEDAKGPFRVRAADLGLQIRGGAFLEASPGRTEVRSFGDVDVSRSGSGAGTLEEGFRGVIEGGRTLPAERLRFADYEDWRVWMVRAYDYKDKAASSPS